MEFLKILIISIIFLYHFCIQNSLEKLFFQNYFNNESIKRPLKNCYNNKLYTSLNCIGMPSGHAEIATIIFCLLYFYKYISFTVCIILILLVSLQRIVTNMHTIQQVIVGIIFGFLYFKYYSLMDCSIYCLLPVIILGLLFSILIIYKINKRLQEPLPDWIDPIMYDSIKKKMSTPYYMKILTIYSNAIIHAINFVSWRDIEIYMDDIIERINKTGIKYDAVVGLKTGGAIISDYISKKLNIKNYKIKLTRSEYNCNKKAVDTVNDILQKHLLYNFGNYDVCEGIDDNIKGKNIILIDEGVMYGKTIISAIKYLKNDKHVNIIFPATLSISKKNYKGNIDINYVLSEVVYVWPWGYDN
jgi:adenine/guanine phosphoribosyltransferase-like PRPP-binding protein